MAVVPAPPWGYVCNCPVGSQFCPSVAGVTCQDVASPVKLPLRTAKKQNARSIELVRCQEPFVRKQKQPSACNPLAWQQPVSLKTTEAFVRSCRKRSQCWRALEFRFRCFDSHKHSARERDRNQIGSISLGRLRVQPGSCESHRLPLPGFQLRM